MTTETLAFESPLGTLTLSAEDGALTALDFGERAARSARPAASPLLAEARDQLLAYLAGERLDFDLALRPRGTTFQLRVWRELASIARGETISYAELARRVGRAGAARAVGAANGRNPLPIFLPCHRVIGADGSLTGYAGGLAKKRWLLELEGAGRPEAAAR